MGFYSSAICILSLALFAQASVELHKCHYPNNFPLPIEFILNDCDDSYCVINVDNPVNVSAVFYAVEDNRDLNLRINVKLQSGRSASFQYEDMCRYLVNDSCPLKKNRTYTLSNSIKLPEIARGNTLDVEVLLFGEVISYTPSVPYFCERFIVELV